jgi:uncharacterized coiled-coil protein SlyX
MLDLPLWVQVAVTFSLVLSLVSASTTMSNVRALRELESIVLLTSATLEQMHNHLSSLKKTVEDLSPSSTQNTSSTY